MKTEIIKREPIFEPSPGGDVFCGNYKETIMDIKDFLKSFSIDELEDEIKKRRENKNKNPERILTEVFMDDVLYKISNKEKIYFYKIEPFGYEYNLVFKEAKDLTVKVENHMSEFNLPYTNIKVFKKESKELLLDFNI